MIGSEWGTVFSVTDRQSGSLEEIMEPQTLLTCSFFTGIDEDVEMDNGGAEKKDNRNIIDNNLN